MNRRTIAASACYWAVLDARRLKGAGKNADREQLGYLFEALLPLPIESVHAVYATLSHGRVLACGVERDRLAGEMADNALTLTPDEVPAELDVHGVAPEDLNLLVGEYQPLAVRRVKRRWALQLVGGVTLLVITFLIGIERRVAAAHGREREARTQLASVYREVLPPSPRPSAVAPVQPDALRLTAELRQLRMTRSSPVGTSNKDGDAAAALANLLSAWPEGEARTELITATPKTASVRVVLADHAAAQQFQQALSSVPGFARAQPQVTAQRDSVRVDLRLSREKEGAP